MSQRYQQLLKNMSGKLLPHQILLNDIDQLSRKRSTNHTYGGFYETGNVSLHYQGSSVLISSSLRVCSVAKAYCK